MKATSASRACAHCDHTAIVGWGTPPEWLCLTHYDHELQRVREIIRTGSKILRTGK